MRLPLLSAGWALDQYKRAQAAADELKEEDRSLVAETQPRRGLEPTRLDCG